MHSRSLPAHRKQRERLNLVSRALPLVLTLIFTWAGTCLAQIETAGFPVTQLDESSRIASLGGRSPALKSEDASSFYSNPALLTADMHRTLSLSYLNHIGSVNAGWISSARSLDSLTTIGAGLRYLSFGTVDRTNESGQKDGTFSASDLSLTVGASRVGFTDFRYGANVNLMLSSIDGTHASALSADAGVLYEWPDARVTLGATIHHAGFVISSFGERGDTIPFDLRLGLTKRLAHMPLLISLTAYRLHRLEGGPSDSATLTNILYHLNLGGEFEFSRSFQVRFGYNHRRHDELKMKSRLDFAGFSMGVGIRLTRVAVDYAFNSWSSLGGLHRFTVRTGL